jgi:hypothetical protein
MTCCRCKRFRVLENTGTYGMAFNNTARTFSMISLALVFSIEDYQSSLYLTATILRPIYEQGSLTEVRSHEFVERI